MINKSLTFLLIGVLLSAPTFASTCKYTTIERTHPKGQYLDNGDGTVTDIVNGLMWQKCSLGHHTMAANAQERLRALLSGARHY